MTLKFKIVFLHGAIEVASIDGVKETDGEHLTLADIDRVIPTEQLLEKLLGLRVHIERVA